MKFDVLTLFPEMFSSFMAESIIGRAVENNLIQIKLTNIRDFSKDKHKKVDDYPFGGGSGMVMQPQPIYDAYKSIAQDLEYSPRVIYMTPSGKPFTQEIAKNLSKEEHIVILCGHYEGVDQRVLDEIVTDEISIGDYVLTGGELPAMVIIDSVSRLVPNVLGNSESFVNESFYSGLLEHPQYTRPSVWNEREVPEILLSGHHEKIAQYQHEQSLLKTLKNRPDLLEKYELSDKDSKFISNYKHR